MDEILLVPPKPHPRLARRILPRANGANARCFRRAFPDPPDAATRLPDEGLKHTLCCAHIGKLARVERAGRGNSGKLALPDAVKAEFRSEERRVGKEGGGRRWRRRERKEGVRTCAVWLRER